MQWQIWIIPLIALAVFILSQLGAKQQQQSRASSRPPLPRDPNEGQFASPRRGSQELEEFLEEIKRRKRAAEEQEPVYVAKEVPPRPVEKRRSAGKPPPRRGEPVIVVQSFPSEAAPPPVAMPMPQEAPIRPDAPQPIFRPEALPAKTAATPVAKLVRDLLGHRKSMRAAFLLREVLDAPLSKRRR
mgnify:CR=1 FL=1